MSKGKVGFLAEIKRSLEANRVAETRDRLAFAYIRDWLAQDDRSNDGAFWLKATSDALEQNHSRRDSANRDNVTRLCRELGLDPSSAPDRENLLVAVADVLVTSSRGRHTEWKTSKFDEFWQDIVLIEERYPAAISKAGAPNFTAIAEKLLSHFGEKYNTQKIESKPKEMIDQLRKRVGKAFDVNAGLNPNLSIIDFDHVVRGDVGTWPPCAADLPKQPSLRKWSEDGLRAKAYEDRLVDRTLKFLSAIGVYITSSSRFNCRRAARKIARARTWMQVEGRSSEAAVDPTRETGN